MSKMGVEAVCFILELLFLLFFIWAAAHFIKFLFGAMAALLFVGMVSLVCGGIAVRDFYLIFRILCNRHPNNVKEDTNEH